MGGALLRVWRLCLLSSLACAFYAQHSNCTMYTLKHNAIETTILHAIPAFPNDRNMLPREVILLAAYDFCEQFVRSVRAYQESNRDERFKPCMKQQEYTEPIYHILEARHERPIYHDKNNVYQVLFAVSCLMGVPNHTRSWWE